jgi:hypothetical protein
MTDPKKINPKYLNHRRGFRSIKPEAMSVAERVRKYRSREGGRSVSFYMHAEAAASLLYLKKQWQIEKTQEVVEAALRYLAKHTRMGLEKLELDVVPDDDIDDSNSQ